MAKYAPRNADGDKPFVVERSEWGKRREVLEYAADARAAEWQVKGRQQHVTTRARRATPADIERLVT